MNSQCQIGENEFFERAIAFLRDLRGHEGRIDPDTDLIRGGVLDSVSLIAFLAFIEKVRGSELVALPDMQNAFTLRSTYDLLRR